MRHDPSVVTSARSLQVGDMTAGTSNPAELSTLGHHTWVRPRTPCPTPKGVQQQVPGQDGRIKQSYCPNHQQFENQGHPEPVIVHWWWTILHRTIHPHICSFHFIPILHLSPSSSPLRKTVKSFFFFNFFFLPLFRNLQINGPKNKWLLKRGWEEERKGERVLEERGCFLGTREPDQGRWSENQFNSWDCD